MVTIREKTFHFSVSVFTFSDIKHHRLLANINKVYALHNLPIALLETQSPENP